MGSQGSRLQAQDSGILLNQGMNQSGNSIENIVDQSATAKATNSINTVFKWNFGGNNVQLTGTFNNWVNPIPLNHIGNNNFEIILKLSPGVYQYKFVVDGQWRFSPDDPTCTDEEGNINNVIDTTNIERTTYLIGNQNDPSSNKYPYESDNYSKSSQQFPFNSAQNGQSTDYSAASKEQNIIHSNQQQASSSEMKYQQSQQYGNQFPIQQNQQLPLQQTHHSQSAAHHDQNPNIIILQQLLQNSRQLGQPQVVQQQYEQLLQQQYQINQLPANLLDPNQNITAQLQQLLQQQQIQMMQLSLQQQQFMQLQEPQNQGVYGITNTNNNMQQTPNKQINGLSEKDQLLGQIEQQNLINFQTAFKETAPQIPPHLLHVSAITKRNVQQVSIWREKEKQLGTSFRSIFQAKRFNETSEIEEESDLKKIDPPLSNTASDDAEVLMQIFQPGHSLTPVDHVTLNHTGIDNHNHRNVYSTYCVTQRFKTKYTTYKFYVSKKDPNLND